MKAVLTHWRTSPHLQWPHSIWVHTFHCHKLHPNQENSHPANSLVNLIGRTAITHMIGRVFNHHRLFGTTKIHLTLKLVRTLRCLWAAGCAVTKYILNTCGHKRFSMIIISEVVSHKRFSISFVVHLPVCLWESWKSFFILVSISSGDFLKEMKQGP